MDGSAKPHFTSNSERTIWYKEQKRVKRQKHKQKYDLKRSAKTNVVLVSNKRTYSERHERRKLKESEIDQRRLYERERKQKQRISKKSKKSNNDTDNIKAVFKHRMNKKRAIDKLKGALPETPKRRAATLSAYLDLPSSPTVKIMQDENIITTPEERKNKVVSEQILDNISTAISSAKHRRSDDKRIEMHTMMASVSGENIAKSKVKTSLAKRLGLNVRRISKGQRVRSHITKTNDSVWKHVQKKSRSDKINDDNKRLIYDFWMSPGISRPTGNKADIKRHRTGPKRYLSHPLYVLEKTQTDVYEEFKEQHSDIKVNQRAFERLKPFFVKPLRTKDKTTCCCRYHIEFNHAFKKCMQYRKSSGLTAEEEEMYPIYDSCEDLISDTLCKKKDDQKYHKKECIDRLCENCGITDDIFTAKELDETESADTVEWERYEYQNVKGKGTIMCRKLVLEKKVTKVGELFRHFRALLEKFPRHQFNALWQNKQAKHIMEQLPEGDVVLVHDFSENYRCSTQKEIQSCYFQKTEVSLHVTIIHRNEIKDNGAIDTDNIIQEQFFVISPDLKHDQHFTYYVQKLISEYLRDINYPLKTVHEFTDGCANIKADIVLVA